MFLGLEKEIKGVADKGLEPANPGLGSLPCSWISEIEWGLGVGGGHWRLSHDHWEGSNDNSLLRTWPHPVSRLVPHPLPLTCPMASEDVGGMGLPKVTYWAGMSVQGHRNSVLCSSLCLSLSSHCKAAFFQGWSLHVG